MSGMNFGYVTENGVNNNVMIKICYWKWNSGL